MIRALVAILLLSASSVLAQPVITSITPTSGPTSGGTEVTITGSGFEYCPVCSPPIGPEVWFGEMRARAISLVSSTQIKAVTPAQPSGEVAVRVDQYNGEATTPQRFRYTGADADAFERVLFPVLTPSIPGAFGSDFQSRLRIVNHGPVAALFAGLVDPCYGLLVAPPCALRMTIPGYGGLFDRTPGVVTDSKVLLAGWPGRFADVTKDALPHLAMNLRAFDTSRDATNFGTEIPVVRDSDFREVIHLTGVPLDPRFRLKLRIYGNTAGFSVYVTAADETQNVELRAPQDPYQPAYTEITFFPPDNPMQGTPPGYRTTDISVRALEPITSPPFLPKPRVWAFVTVTNNDTQHITTITPQ